MLEINNKIKAENPVSMQERHRAIQDWPGQRPPRGYVDLMVRHICIPTLLGDADRGVQPFTASPLALGRMYLCKPTNSTSTGRIEITEPAATRRQSREKLLASCWSPKGRV